MGIVFKNNAKTTLASSLSNSATSATVTDGSVFPSLSAGEFFLLTFDDGTNNEICKCTARSGNTLTIVRAQESTTARAFSSGDAAEGRVTAGVLETIQENIAAKSANQTVYNTTTASSATDYDIGIDPSVEANAMVFLNGVMQHHDTFSFSGSTLTFDAAPPNGMALEVIVDNLINLQSSNLTVDTFTATSGQTDFVLSDTPAAETNLIVFVDGVFQDQDSYTISNNTLTITDGVVLDRGVTVYVINPVNIGTPSDGTVTSAKLSGNITMPGTLTVGSNDVAFDSPTFVVDNANSRVGLGTASPSVPVDIVGDVKMSANLTVDTSTLVVDSTNNRVGIGTDSPSEALEVDGNIQIKFAGVNVDPDGARYLYFNNTDTTLVAGQPLGGISFINNDATSTAGEAAYIKAYATTNTGSTELRFGIGTQNSPSEAMRIDSSGNLLVGTTQNNPTSSSVNVAGQEFSTTGGVRSTVASNPAATFNRKTDDGNIVLFRKDGTTVGIIGSSSPALYIGSGDVGVRFDGANDRIRPVGNASNLEAVRDNAIDLGDSAARFKDLYLSGATKVGSAETEYAEGHIRFKFNGGSYIDQNTVGQSLNFRVSNASSLDTTAMTIDSSGLVGIGDTSPDKKLHITDTSGNHLRIAYNDSYYFDIGRQASDGRLSISDNVNGEAMAILPNGNVLIGTTTSEAQLTVEGDTSSSQFTALALKHDASSSDQGADMTCDMDFYLWDSNTRISTPQARIGVTGDATADQNYEAGGQLCFYTNIRSNTSPSLTERMRINPSGQVGIACTDQSNLLTVDANSASSGTDSISVRNRGVSSVNNTTGLRFQFNSAVPSAIRSRLTNTSNGAGTLSFYTSSDGSAANLTERYSIDTVGRLISGSSSFAHNTYGHAAVFTKNSVPNGVVVIEDSDVSSGIGNTVLNLYLRDQDPASYAVFCEFRDGGGRVGSITHNDDGGGVTYNTTSDYRLKEHVNYTWDALPLINQLKPAKFNFIGKTDKTRQGFLAHEVSDIVPGSVKGDKDQMEPIGTIRDNSGNIVDEGVYEHFCKEGQTWTQTGTEPIYQQLDYARLVPLLTKAIQEQQEQIETLKQEIREIREGG